MKKFKNTLSVRGTHQQLMAFAEFAKSIGWQYQHREGCEEHGILYFSTNPHAGYPSMSCWLAIDALVKCYDLPAQWQAAMDAASEVEKVRFEVGKKYINESGEIVYCTGLNTQSRFIGFIIGGGEIGYSSSVWGCSFFTPYPNPVTL